MLKIVNAYKKRRIIGEGSRRDKEIMERLIGKLMGVGEALIKNFLLLIRILNKRFK